MRNFIIKTLSTFFYIGYLPLIPGTFASMGGLLIFCLIKGALVPHLFFTLLLIALGFFISGRAERLFGKKDARCIVIDEVGGMLLGLLFIPYDLKLALIAFLLFRIFDALKPYPAGTLQKLKGSLGVMSDDIVAALYTNIVLQFVLRLVSLKAS